MSVLTDFLKLFKYEPEKDGAKNFNITEALNNNWDKVDEALKITGAELSNKANGKWTFYSTLAELGIAEGNETINGIIAALPDFSSITYGTSVPFNTAQYPQPYLNGICEIVKVSSPRVFLVFTDWEGKRHIGGYTNTFTGWQEIATTKTATLALLNGWKYADDYSGYQPKVYKCGNVVTVTGVITGGVKDTLTQICIIPPAFAPKVSVYQRLLCNDNASFGVLISRNGAVDIRTLVTAINVHFNFSYGI